MMHIIKDNDVHVFYTDGATSKNGSEDAVGGWAWAEYIPSDPSIPQNYASGAIAPATNNICELTAVLKACEFARNKNYTRVIICSDSAYLVNCYSDRWYSKWIRNDWINSKGEPVKNRELWEKLIPYFESNYFSFEKVAGHAGIKENEFVDKLAVKARMEGVDG